MDRLRSRFSLAAAIVLSTVSGMACKSQPGPELKGLTVGETTKEIDYEALLGGKGADQNALNMISVIAFESSYKSRQLDAPAGWDEGTKAAYEQIRWLKENAGPQVFGGKLTIEQNDFPERADAVVMSKIYKFVAVAKDVEVTYPRRSGDTTKRIIDVRMQVILGAAMARSVRGPLDMPEDYRKMLSEAFVRGDVVTYNGHIWTTEESFPSTPWSPAPVDGTTLALRDEMKKLGGRGHYGLIYMNACRGEQIERAVMAGLIATGAERIEPLLLSHRNYSNYGYFAEHNAHLLLNLLHGRPLARVVFDLTTSLKRHPLADTLTPKGREGEDDVSGPEATRRLAAYYKQPGVTENPHSVIVVAYDVVRGQPLPRAFE